MQLHASTTLLQTNPVTPPGQAEMTFSATEPFTLTQLSAQPLANITTRLDP